MGTALALCGCAVGTGIGYTSASISAVKSPRSGFSEDLTAHGATAYQEFRIIDTTGVLLAAMVNAGRAYNARAEAAEQAKYDTPDDHGVVHFTYSYEPMPILSGLLTDLRVRIGLGAPTLELPPGMDSMREIHYWEMDLRPEFYTFRPLKSLPLVSSLWLSASFSQWKADDLNYISFDASTFEMSFGTSSTYLINQDLAVTGRAGIGVLSPLLAVFSGGGWFNPQVEAEIGWRPVQTSKVGLTLSANAYIRREFAVDRNIVSPGIGINAALSLGDQRPKDRRHSDDAAATPAPAPAAPVNLDDPTQPVSGNVCGGNAPAPECKTMGDRLPGDAQILLASCVIATQNATKTLTFDTQPQTCRTAGDALQNLARKPELSADQRKLVHGAAAIAYDLAGAGYELAAGSKRWGMDQCAMLEQTHNQLNPEDGTGVSIPSRGAIVDAAIAKCRTMWTCTLDPANHQISCTAVTATP